MGQCVKDTLRGDALLQKQFQIVWEGSLRSHKDLLSLSTCGCDVIIDFSKPQGSLAWSEAFAKSKKKIPPALICVTGFSRDQIQKLSRHLSNSKWALVPNTSLGIAALTRSLKTLCASLDSNYQITLFESHHKLKADAPSGTAFHLQKAIESVCDLKVEMHSTRGGSDPGTHTIFILGPHEKIEITHRAEDRKLFARGALMLAQKLLNKKIKASSKALGIEDLL
jgi:4-hydroxy-tetrahydrodipicolinate reductase